MTQSSPAAAKVAPFIGMVSVTRALLWKEWRESRRAFFGGLIALVVLPETLTFVYLILEPGEISIRSPLLWLAMRHGNLVQMSAVQILRYGAWTEEQCGRQTLHHERGSHDQARATDQCRQG